MQLTEEERECLSGDAGPDGARMALRLVVRAAELLGARRLVRIEAAHIDGCLYHGASGTLFCERLVDQGARVSVPATTNVGALNLLKPEQSRLQGDARKMAYRLMVAHEKLGCRPSWTCAPYQAGARPSLGTQVAWGESNAVAFCNSVLGARTNRYGDFLDIACAISGRAPASGLHLDDNRFATRVYDLSEVPRRIQEKDVFWPVLGAWLGRVADDAVCALTGIEMAPDEDALKAFCAAAAATGSVGLVHLVGITPEAPDLKSAVGGREVPTAQAVTVDMLARTETSLSNGQDDRVDAVALGSPHFSARECRALAQMTDGQRFRLPVYVCTGRHVLADLEADGTHAALEACGVRFVTDTCVVVTPILPQGNGVLMTNSAKFAQYATPNTGYRPVFASLQSCVASAQAGRLVRVETLTS